MSFKKGVLFPCNPNTERGISTKLSVYKSQLVYANGKSVIIRDLHNPTLASAYSGHTKNVSVARISPSGYYCASADVQGTVRVWDTTGEERVLKGEYKTLSGRINDLAWDGESKRIIVVGDGREKFGHAFMFDSGSSTGEITGHSKVINAVAIRHQRPFRAATAADDALIVFHQGAPYKYEKTIKTHTKFVQDVRYAANGEFFASVGSDAKAFLYDGKTGETVAEFEDGHKGSIMACSWSPDDKTISTSSADCTVKLWDVETRKAAQTWSLGSGVSNQQVGNVWSPSGEIVSLSISGDLNVFDARVGDAPARVLKGVQRAITAGAALPDSGTFIAGSADGRVLAYDAGVSTENEGGEGEVMTLEGDGHTNFVAAIVPGKGKGGPGSVAAFSVGYDDQLKEISGGGWGFGGASTPLGSQPKALAVGPDLTVFVAESSVLEAIRLHQKVAEVSTPYGASSVDASEGLVAVGGEASHDLSTKIFVTHPPVLNPQDQKVHLYGWDGKAFTESGTLEGFKGRVTSLKFSPDSNLLAGGDSTGKIILFNVKDRKAVESRWSFHSATINSLAWAADGVHLASGSLDTHVYVWSVKKPLSYIANKNAGPGGVICVAWLETEEKKGRLLSTGSDACIRTWEVTFKL